MRIEHHPYLNVWVREDGGVYLSKSGPHKAHWTYGSKDSLGYRQVSIAGKRYLAHRLVAEAYFGEIPDGYEIDHQDRNRSNNRLDNIRIVSRFENRRNRADHDRVTERGGTHTYEDAQKAWRENAAHYRENKRKTHRQVQFSDGSHRWIPLPEAEAYLIIPLKERHYDK